MQDEPNHEQRLARRPAAARRNPAAPSSSRMFASYLTDIERLAEEQRWDAALREALDLPRLAVALADPELRCAREQVLTWCQEWIRPAEAERDAHGLDLEPLMQRLLERLERQCEPDRIPMRALRRLQLRRHLRAPPSGYFTVHAENLPPRESEILDVCSLLFAAGRRWYARSACHDPTVQVNLARIAVLR
jgi:hypothetical protein